jgi:hypothetical protein
MIHDIDECELERINSSLDWERLYSCSCLRIFFARRDEATFYFKKNDLMILDLIKLTLDDFSNSL